MVMIEIKSLCCGISNSVMKSTIGQKQIWCRMLQISILGQYQHGKPSNTLL